MALSIFYKNKRIRAVHIPFEDQHFDREDISYIQADGHELDHIQGMFIASIPMPLVQVAKWPEPWASLILLNITKKAI